MASMLCASSKTAFHVFFPDLRCLDILLFVYSQDKVDRKVIHTLPVVKADDLPSHEVLASAGKKTGRCFSSVLFIFEDGRGKKDTLPGAAMNICHGCASENIA